MKKLTVEQYVDITNHIVRKHNENKNRYLGSSEYDNFTWMAHHFCSHIVSLTDDTNMSSHTHKLSCISIIIGNSKYSTKKINHYSITIEQFSALLERLLGAYDKCEYWHDKKSEDKLALDAITTILYNILKDRLTDNPRIKENISISFGDNILE